MKVYHSKYQLTLKKFSAKHISVKGALFCFKGDHEVSYGLYHPIESLGDKPLDLILKDFKDLVIDGRGSLNSIFKLSLKESENQKIKVPCYKLCRNFDEANLVVDSLVKIKVTSVEEITEGVNVGGDKKYILDANGQLQIEDLNFLKEKNLHTFIKYLEDPVKDKKIDLEGLKVASDFLDYDAYDYKVVKPTGFCHPIENRLGKPEVVTSYLDHPLGQIIAAKYAHDNRLKEPCGLMTHDVFEPNAYSDLLSNSGDFEFQDYESLFKILEKEEWRELS